MAVMPKPRYRHLCREIAANKQVIWYFRAGHGARVRLRSPYGSPEFEAEYLAALEGRAMNGGRAASGTVAWLVDRYRESADWASLSLATRRQRENILKQVIERAGTEPVNALNKRSVQAGIDTRAKTPHQARHFLDSLNGLYRWAVRVDLARKNPCDGAVLPKRGKSEGFPVWTEADLAAFEKRWPVGTRERLAFDLLLYTGLRRGDVVRVGRQHVRNGEIHLRTAKTGTEVIIPILPELAASIAATATGDMSYIVASHGRPMVKEAFGNWFSEACRAAGIAKSAHGLRKAGATRAANNGATVAQLEAIFGWHGGGMASLYTRGADRARLARSAINKLARNEAATNHPATEGVSRDQEKKAL